MTPPRKPPRRPRPRPRLSPPPSPPSRKPDTEPLPAWLRNDPAALRAALNRLIHDHGPYVSDLFPCLPDEQESNRHGKDTRR